MLRQELTKCILKQQIFELERLLLNIEITYLYGIVLVDRLLSLPYTHKRLKW